MDSESFRLAEKCKLCDRQTVRYCIMTFCSKKEFLIKRFIDHVFDVLWSINLLLILRRNFWLLAPGDGAKERLDTEVIVC